MATERIPRSLEIQCPVCNARVGQECFQRWKGDDGRHSYERVVHVPAISVACPFCKAQPNEPCMSLAGDGPYKTHVHTHRRMKAIGRKELHIKI
jgi:sarcosine oxidase delta subunit